MTGGEVIRIADFAREKERDDLYRLTVSAMDLAGNVAEQTITFSVNRFGSVYTFDDKTEKLLRAYYTSQVVPLTVTETNVDTLVHREIICNLNGKLKTLVEGRDYSVRKTGDESSWKQYQYMIPAENFMEEGHYVLTIYSEDRASNISNNQMKGKKIEFAVDRTNPGILISGVEPEGRYREKMREITVDVQDNLTISEVTVLLNKKKLKFNGTEIMENKGIISINAESADDWQTIQVYAADMTGNETYSEELRFLITQNVLIQFYRNTPLFYGSIGLIAISGIFLVLNYNRKKRKNE